MRESNKLEIATATKITGLTAGSHTEIGGSKDFLGYTEIHLLPFVCDFNNCLFTR